MELLVAGKTDVGLAREINQDAIFYAQNQYVAIFAVADGMGGHSEGEVASRCMIECVESWWNSQIPLAVKNNRQDTVRNLSEVLRQESNRLFDMFASKGSRGGTTLCLLILFGDTYTTLSVGDSRIYRVGNSELEQITTDDEWGNLPEVKAEYDRETIIRDPRFGKLTMAAGYDRDITLRVCQGIVKKGDTFLLCSDGIYRFCNEQKLYNILKAKGWFVKVPKLLEKIEEEVRTNGARDNYSAIVCRVC